MKIYRISKEECPDEYGYNLCSDSRVANVNWNESDLYGVWTEKSVKRFLALPDDAIVYKTLADISDLNESLVEEDPNEDSGGYDWSELKMIRKSPPPIVITRKLDDTIEINDGNHRVRFWRENGKQYIPSWCYDEKITKWIMERNAV